MKPRKPSRGYVGYFPRRWTEHCDWVSRVARECSGWPQHLQTGLQALANALVVNEGKLGPTVGDFANAVSEQSAIYRNEYYEDWLDDDLSGCLGLLYLVLELAHLLGKPLVELKRDIAVRANNNGGHKHRLPDGFNASMLLDRLLERGFLQLSNTGRRYIFPIPSLTDYIGELVGD